MVGWVGMDEVVDVGYCVIVFVGFVLGVGGFDYCLFGVRIVWILGY